MPNAKKPKLTVKEAKLVKAKAEGATHVEAYHEAYDSNANDNTAAVEASRTLNKPHVQEALQVALAEQGITLEKIIAPVAMALEAKVRIKAMNGTGEVFEMDAPDLDMQLKGHDRAMRIINPKSEGSGTTINNFGTIVAEMKDNYAD